MQPFLTSESQTQTRVQRWANLVMFLTAVGMLLLGLLLRFQFENTTEIYRAPEAGILAQYPVNWLLDTEGRYVFRVRNPNSPTFLTTLQVAVAPVGTDATARNVLDTLTLERSRTLAAYQTRPAQPYTLPDGEEATSVTYAYVETEDNPFLDSLPVVVLGLDIVVIKRGQAVIITYRADKDVYEAELSRLERFLAALEF